MERSLHWFFWSGTAKRIVSDLRDTLLMLVSLHAIHTFVERSHVGSEVFRTIFAMAHQLATFVAFLALFWRFIRSLIDRNRP